MKTKIIISLVIFISFVIYFKEITVVGLSEPVALADMPWDFEKTIIWGFIILSSGMFASIPYWKMIYQKVFLYR